MIFSGHASPPLSLFKSGVEGFTGSPVNVAKASDWRKRSFWRIRLVTAESSSCTLLYGERGALASGVFYGPET